MIEIRLSGAAWSFDEQDMLGSPGGFGAVFRGRGADGEAVAIKLLHAQYQGREMRIADFLLGHGLAHVIPILDTGFDSNVGTNFIVMPVAESNLQQRINQSGQVGEAEALEILAEIAAGLDEIGDIIHRDLKPDNVLFHEGVWKLADLGLARFAQETTSLRTMRGFLTKPYAAPEQWRSERPTKKTDVYAFGCIMYALLHGAPPFAGPEEADFSEQHQFVVPTALDASPHLRRLAMACLAKSPELRPSVSSLKSQLRNARELASRGDEHGLAAAAAAVAEQRALAEDERLQSLRAEEHRKRLAAEAVKALLGLFEEMEETIRREAPNARLGDDDEKLGDTGAKLREALLGSASLRFGLLYPYLDAWTRFWETPAPMGARLGSREWDVLAGAYISISAGWRRNRGRSANLWFGRLLTGDDYRWWEVSYVRNVSYRWTNEEANQPEPLGLTAPSYQLGSGYLVAQDPVAITPESVQASFARWLGLFAQVAADNRSDIDYYFSRKPVAPEFKLDHP